MIDHAKIRPTANVISYGLFLLIFILAAGCSGTRPTQDSDDDNQVDIAYGSVDEEEVTGAVTTIEGDDIDAGRNQSISEILMGKVSGVDVTELPGGGFRVRIRNSRSNMSGTEPLYVIDGMPVSTTNGALYGINPREVESISVLKDAASTSMYGSRGANGVIIIKTKRARN